MKKGTKGPKQISEGWLNKGGVNPSPTTKKPVLGFIPPQKPKPTKVSGGKS